MSQSGSSVLPSSGALSFNDLYTEFDGYSGGNVRLSDYYRGGAKVPNIAQNANIPTSGQISVTNFYNGLGYFEVYITIYSGAYYKYNLSTLLTEFGWNGTKPVKAVITISSGVYFALNPFGPDVLSGATEGKYSLTIPSLPATSILTLNNYGSIQGEASYVGATLSPNSPDGVGGSSGLLILHNNVVVNNYSGGVIAGAGGTGGAGSDLDTDAGTGGNGGHAIAINCSDYILVAINNFSGGTIAGGGGGGGGGGRGASYGPFEGVPGGYIYAVGGGGGGGRNCPSAFWTTAGGPPGDPNYYVNVLNRAGQYGGIGTSTGAGAGGLGGLSDDQSEGGYGGAGGGRGDAGGVGSPGNSGGGNQDYGGAAGHSIKVISGSYQVYNAGTYLGPYP
jgi:hypothetical protein